MFSTLIVLTALASSSLAIFTPTEPSSTSVFREGGACTITWVPDTTGAWTQTKIELKTGDNFQMVHVKDIAIVNGSDAKTTTYSYPCYSVEPNSAIYFYQFSSADAPANTTWTTRFTIAGAGGETTPPANPLQPGTNDPIPWGVGALEDPTQADATTTGATGATGVTTPAGTTPTTGPTTNAPTGSKTGTGTGSATVTSPTATRTGSANVISGSNFAVAAAAALIGSMML
jgi:hypothetical protein